MEIVIHGTIAAQRAMLEAPVEARLAICKERILAPLRPVWSIFVGHDPQAGDGEDARAEAAARMVGMFDLRADAGEHLAALDQLEAAGAEGALREALERGARAFTAAGRALPLDRVQGSLLLGDRTSHYFMELMRGYTGNGSIPGYVLVSIWPTPFTLPRVGAAAAHEFHHNVRLSYAPFAMDISVGEYIVLEGLAESFAAALYGHDLVGPWVTALSAEELERSRAIIGGALDVRGFNNVRPYLFGDTASFAGYEPIGLPFCAGYAVGFRVVQAYLERTGRSIVDATFTPAAEIIEESRYF
jgi:uncharacterized protein YjaZ